MHNQISPIVCVLIVILILVILYKIFECFSKKETYVVDGYIPVDRKSAVSIYDPVTMYEAGIRRNPGDGYTGEFSRFNLNRKPINSTYGYAGNYTGDIPAGDYLSALADTNMDRPSRVKKVRFSENNKQYEHMESTPAPSDINSDNLHGMVDDEDLDMQRIQGNPRARSDFDSIGFVPEDSSMIPIPCTSVTSTPLAFSEFQPTQEHNSHDNTTQEMYVPPMVQAELDGESESAPMPMMEANGEYSN